ncbi:MAG TPA: sigma-70 family RNA polymerase sigma factor [Variovorax sp.]|nr:sigma-70 family RNA polymerase sigma factor [Variovorax sp.]
MSASSPDAELMALLDRVGQRDEAALRLLYERTAPRLLGLAMRVLRQREWAEDALQESFLTIWRIAGDYRASLSPPLAWMGLIVRSRSLDVLRKQAADRSHTQSFDEEAIAETVPSDVNDPVDEVNASEQARALHRCLGELAQQLALPLGTVKTWIRRGLDKLRNCMKQFA